MHPTDLKHASLETNTISDRFCLTNYEKLIVLAKALEYNIKTGLHYQSFCDHSRNFASVNSMF